MLCPLGPCVVWIEKALLNRPDTSVGSIVGIRVGGTNSGLEVGSTVAVTVGLGASVSVTVGVKGAVDDGIGDGVEVTDDPHALNNKPIMRKTTTRERFFMLTHSFATMLVVLLPTVYP